NSNLWFTAVELPDQLGPTTAEGAVWLNEAVDGGVPSEPFLFAGWPVRSVWINNEGDETVNFSFEIDEHGNSTWRKLRTESVPAQSSALVPFAPEDAGEWIRVTADGQTIATVHFYYADQESRGTSPDDILKGLAAVTHNTVTGGLLYGLGDNRRALGMQALTYNGSEKTVGGYYELDAEMKLEPKDDPETMRLIGEKFAIPEKVITIDASSVLIL